MRVLVLLLCCWTLPVQAKLDPWQACLNLAKQHDKHQVHLKKDCPALFKELDSQGLLKVAEPPLPDQAGLAQLQFIAAGNQLQGADAINRDCLEQLLAGILSAEKTDPQAEWWQAFLKWLDSLQTGDYEQEYQWLLRLFKAIKPSEQTVLIFIYGSMAMLVLSALWLVLSELYGAGFFASRKNGQQTLPEKSSRQYSLTLAPNRQNPPGLTEELQIAALLEQAIVLLVERNVIPADASLTHRQMLRYVLRHTSDLAPPFARLVTVAEPVIYGGQPVGTGMLEHYRDDVQALLGAPQR